MREDKRDLLTMIKRRLLALGRTEDCLDESRLSGEILDLATRLADDLSQPVPGDVPYIIRTDETNDEEALKKLDEADAAG